MPTLPSGSTVVVILSAGGLLTTMESARVSVPAALSATWMVKLDEPVAEGMPEMRPDEELRDSPAGSDPADVDQV